MKKFVGFYYRCSFNTCVWVFLSLIGFMVLPSSAFALQSGDFTYTVSGGTVTITAYNCPSYNAELTPTQAVIPDSIDGMPVVGIGNSAFANCSGLTSVTIGNSVTSIGYNAFYGCSGLTSIVVDASNTVYSSQDGVLYNKDMTVLIGYPGGQSGGFTIPSSVTSIGDYAFYGCRALTSVTIGNSVKSIGNGAFSYCSGLTSVTIPDSVTSIGQNAFENCYGLTSVTIGNNVTSIGGYAFYYCSGLTSVTIPNSVTSIRDCAFAYCSGLNSVTIGNSVTSIGNFAFSNCYGLTSVTIGNSVTSIGNSAFYFCTPLNSINIPNSVASIGSYAFAVTGLTSVTIPDSITSIGSGAFRYCYGLTSIVVDASNTAYSSQDGVLYNKAGTVLIQYPGGKSGGFTIPDSVTSIGDSAFHSCIGLTSVTIPNSVTSISSYAFYNCTNLTKAYFLGNAPSMGSSVFNGHASNFNVCYTAGSTGFTTPTWCWGLYDCCPAAVCEEPTVITLSSFTAIPKAGKVILQWSTESELDNAGFNIYRATAENGEYKKINNVLITAEGSATNGASYTFTDTDVLNRKTYYYKLEDIDLNGTSTMHGPVSATPRLIYGIGK